MMKKIMYVFLTFFLSLSTFGQGTPIITMIADGDESGGTPEVLEIYANGAVDFSQYSLQNQTNGGTTWGNTFDLSPLGTVTDAFVYVYSNKNNSTDVFASNYPSVTANTLDATSSSILNINGDDRVRIIETGSGTVIDNYGVENEDGSNKPWEYTDGYAKRINGTGPDAVFVEANWEYHKGELNTHGAVQDGTTYESIIGIGSYTPPAAACADPSNGTASNITDTQADLSWTAGGNESAWNIEYGTTGFTQGQGTIVNVTTNPYTLTGLTANTSYDFYVQADCGNGDTSGWAGPFTFTTASGCSVVTAPWSEGFEGNFDFTCWTNEGTSSHIWEINDGTTHGPGNTTEGTQAVMFDVYYTSRGNTATLTTPVIDMTTLASPLLSFDYWMNGSADTDLWLKVEISTDGTNWTEIFNQVEDGTISSWTNVALPLSGTNASTQLRFTASSDYGSYNIFIDNIRVNEAPSCLAPSDISVSNITSNSADLSWTAGGSETAWNIEYGPAGFAQGQGTTVNATTNPYTLSGLSSNTSYDFYVQADCGGGDSSNWVGPYNFMTSPACGDTFYDDGGANGDYSANLNQTFTIYPQNAGDVVTVTFNSFDMEQGYDGMMVYNGADTSAPLIDSGSTYNRPTCPNGAWTGAPGNTYTADGQSFTSTDASGALTFVFTTDSSGQHSGWEATVTCAAPPTCPAPTDLAVANITSDSADLSWTAGGNETAWNIEYGTTGFAQGSGTTVNVTDNPYTLTGLTGNTSYDVYVQADCGAGDTSTWVGPYTFTTACGVYTPDYIEDFTDFLPGCWEEAKGPVSGPTTTGNSTWTSDGFANNGASGSARVNLFSNSHEEWLISPVFDLSGGNYELSFDVAVTAYSDDTASPMGSDDEVQLLVSTDNGATWSNLMTWNTSNTPSNTGDNITFNLANYPQNNVQFAFWASDGSVDDSEDYNFYVDNFAIQTVLSCDAPTSLSADNITDVQADLSWTAGGSETAWNIEYGPTGFAQGQGTTVNVTSNPYTLTGLTADTSYDFYVQADCGNGNTSDWAGPYSFTTASAPPVCGDTFYDDGGPTGPYSANLNQSFTIYPQNAGDVVTVTFNSFDMEEGWDGMMVYNGADTSAPLIDSGSTFNRTNCPNGAWTGAPGDPYTADGVSFISTDASGALTFVFTSDGSVQHDGWEAVVTCGPPPSCPAPTDLTVSNINNDSADLGWTAGGNESSWNIEYGPTGFTQGNGTIVNVTDNPYTLTGLTSATAYDFYVQADCGGGDTSVWVGPYTFVTACDAVSTFPYDYGFEDLTPNTGGDWSASCWSANPENTGSDSFSGPYRWTPTDGSTPSSGTGPSAANSGSMYAYTEASGSNDGDIAELISPIFDMSNLTQPELKFYYFMYGADMGSLHVDTYDGTTWTEDVWSISGEQQTADTDAWIQVTVSIPNNVTRIKFRSIRGADYKSDMAVDDISISETGSVNELTNISAIYPNPTTGQFIIKSHDLNEAEVYIYTMTGKEIYHNTIDNDTYMVNLRDVNNGVYFIKIISENKSYVSKLIVK